MFLRLRTGPAAWPRRGTNGEAAAAYELGVVSELRGAALTEAVDVGNSAQIVERSRGSASARHISASTALISRSLPQSSGRSSARGVPGAGWLIAAVFALAAIVFGNSWWQGGHGARGAPPASNQTSGVAH